MILERPIRRFNRLLVLMSMLVMLLAGCTSSVLPIQTVFQSNHCAIAEKSLHRLMSHDELLAVLPPRLPGSAADKVTDIPAVDFSSEQAILITWGAKGNNGYGIELTANQVENVDGLIELPIIFQTPVAGRFYAQVMTSPCMILTIPTVADVTIVAGDMRFDPTTVE